MNIAKKSILILAFITITLPFLLTTTSAKAQDANCDAPTSQLEMNICAMRDFERADRALNAIWPAAMRFMKNLDADLPKRHKGGPKELLNAQRLWIKFRDAHCESSTFIVAGGTIRPLLFNSCRAEVTRRRTAQLTAIANGE